MQKCKLLAFLLCENATLNHSDGKVTLHGVFDRMIIPKARALPKLFFVYYKIVVVQQPCTIVLKLTDPAGGEVKGNWRDTIEQTGPVHSIWALIDDLFTIPGTYALDLMQEAGGSDKLSLASMVFVVEQQSE
jgi:hypothetical protein